jgi:phosphotransferase system  glucose/maltose/N-acetylglucosamine-specific IIC component
MSLGPVRVGPLTFSLYWMLFGLTLSVVGMQCISLGCLVQVMYDFTGSARARWLRIFGYTRSVLLSCGLVLLGVALVSFLVLEYFKRGLALPTEIGRVHHLAVTGLLLVIGGFMNFVLTLVIHAAELYTGRSGKPPG